MSRKKKPERNLSRVLGKDNCDHFLNSTPHELNKLVHIKKNKSNTFEKSKSLYRNFFINQPRPSRKKKIFLLSGSHKFSKGIKMNYNKNFDKR